MRKKKSPVVEMTGQIYDEIQNHNVLVQGYKDDFVRLLENIEFNLRADTVLERRRNPDYALGLTRGALMMFGKRPQ